MPPSISSPTHSPSHGPPCRRSPPFSPSASGAAADHPVSARRRPLAAQIVILHRRFPTPRSPIGLPAARRQHKSAFSK
uniref:Uncharacterized protein n=1 Tax=Oryza punctata TaxID=4537 RepID=A0A0E0KGD5_ORYPU